MQISTHYSIALLTTSLLFVICLLASSSASSSSDPISNLHYCLYPDSTNPIELDQHLQNHEKKSQSLRYEYMSNRWIYFATPPSQGTSNGSPLTLTWSIIPDGVSIPGNGGEPTSNSNLRSFLTGIYGSQAAYIAMFNQSFNSWDSLTGVNFIYEPNDDGATMFTTSGKLGVRGDIRIGGHPIDGNYNVLAYTYSPNSGDMAIDTSDSFYSANKNWAWQVVAHELGHALGLAHTCPLSQTKLMEPYFSTSFVGPQHDDILGAQAFYGDLYESNNGIASSAMLGSLGSGSTIGIKSVSLHSSGDVDYYSFIAGMTGSVTVSAYATGQTYNVGGVGEGGVANSCSGTFAVVNTNTIYDLILSVYDGNKMLIQTSNSGGVGGGESVTIEVSGGGIYYVQVYTTSTAASSDNVVQMYNLTLAAGASSGASSSPSVSKSNVASASGSISKSTVASVSGSISRTMAASASSSISRTRLPSSRSVSVSRTASRSRRRTLVGREEIDNESSASMEESVEKPVMQVDVHSAPKSSEEENQEKPVMQIDVHSAPEESSV